jgi:hypothetical protein
LTRRIPSFIMLFMGVSAMAFSLQSYRVIGKDRVRPVYFYPVDTSEFAVNKLADRGSLTAHSILTNVQDFVVTVERGLLKACSK